MIHVIYYRTKAKVEDYRIFRDEAEFEEWHERQEKLEHVIIRKKWSR